MTRPRVLPGFFRIKSQQPLIDQRDSNLALQEDYLDDSAAPKMKPGLRCKWKKVTGEATHSSGRGIEGVTVVR